MQKQQVGAMQGPMRVELAEVPSRLELIGMILIASALAIIAIHSMRKHEEVDPAIGQE